MIHRKKSRIKLLMNMQRCNQKNIKSQQGVVIVVALFFVALIAMMSYYMMNRLARDTLRTQLLLRNVKAELYAQGSIYWALEQLKTDVEKQKPNLPVDKIPLQSPIDEMQGYKIYSVITDAQSRFNLNTLTNTDAQVDFKKLLRLLAPDLNDKNAQDIVLAAIDWITPGQQQNELNKYYMSLPLPYRAAHRPMVSASELQLVKGMTPALYRLLENYITALPSSSAFVNVQTATAPVLAALSPNMTIATAKAIEAKRSQVNISSVDAFLAMDLLKNHPIKKEKIVVLSHYFLIETIVEIEKQHIFLYTLVERSGDQGKSTVRIVWQSKGISA